MPTCNRTICLGLVLLAVLLSTGTVTVAATPGTVSTPYEPVSLPFELHQVPDTPVYYVIGHAGVPGTDNEGHTSNAGFVVTDGGVVVFDAWEHRHSLTACCNASGR